MAKIVIERCYNMHYFGWAIKDDKGKTIRRPDGTGLSGSGYSKWLCLLRARIEWFFCNHPVPKREPQMIFEYNLDRGIG